VTCLEVRDRLAEFALGVLPQAERSDVERHVEWCAGCRKEAGELQQGAAVVGRALPPEHPPIDLEDRVVERLATSAGAPRRSRPGRTRRGVLTLAAATLAALVIAGGAVGWASAERARVQSFQETTKDLRDQIDALRALIRNLPGSRQEQANLNPLPAGGGTGQALISTVSNEDDWVLASVNLVEQKTGTYSIQVTDGNGTSISGGPLNQVSPGSLVYWEQTGADLSKADWVTVYDPAGQAILTGKVHRVQATPSPAGS
jgi:hypothetical protein